MGDAIHIYASPWQPATRFSDYCVEPMFVDERAPRSLVYCERCRRRRWAQHMEVQVYYDSIRTRCKAGHGCRKEASDG